ncbi:hypothetical protein [Pseudomonas ovata]|uniref:hypothetical protein n=1 Tax=Pseudomonas ovata TaxID=1839709 RepID=UPI000D69B5F4|nr:hypothetical protein [Pseudomonas ovata]
MRLMAAHVRALAGGWKRLHQARQKDRRLSLGECDEPFEDSAWRIFLSGPGLFYAAQRMIAV